MKRLVLCALWISTAALTALVLVDIAGARERGTLRRTPAATSWHAGYADPAWGTPLAVVVPPTAKFQTHYNWGVGGTRVTPIYPQFQPNYPGPGLYPHGPFQPVPPWPTSTDQLGFYYIRGPW
jgi:hypothetical protein